MAQGLNSKRSLVLMDEIRDRLFTLQQRGYYVLRALEEVRDMRRILLTAMEQQLKAKT